MGSRGFIPWQEVTHLGHNSHGLLLATDLLAVSSSIVAGTRGLWIPCCWPGIAAGSETWAVEVKHQSGGVTVARVDRFLRARRFYEEETGNRIDRLWYVSQACFRTEARERCPAEAIYFSTTRHVAQLERVAAE